MEEERFWFMFYDNDFFICTFITKYIHIYLIFWIIELEPAHVSPPQCSDGNCSRPCKVSTLKLISTASLVCQTDSSSSDKSEEQTSPAFLTRVRTRCQLRPASTKQCTLTPLDAASRTITARVFPPRFFTSYY